MIFIVNRFAAWKCAQLGGYTVQSFKKPFTQRKKCCCNVQQNRIDSILLMLQQHFFSRYFDALQVKKVYGTHWNFFRCLQCSVLHCMRTKILHCGALALLIDFYFSFDNLFVTSGLFIFSFYSFFIFNLSFSKHLTFKF